jgi:hypothetical protein
MASRPADLPQLQTARDDLRATLDPHEAGHDADLLIESVPEQLTLKRQVFTQFADICPPGAIFDRLRDRAGPDRAELGAGIAGRRLPDDKFPAPQSADAVNDVR